MKDRTKSTFIKVSWRGIISNSKCKLKQGENVSYDVFYNKLSIRIRQFLAAPEGLQISQNTWDQWLSFFLTETFIITQYYAMASRVSQCWKSNISLSWDFCQGGGMNSYKIFTVDYLIFSYKVRKLWHSSTPFSSQNQNYYQIELMTVNMTNH